MHTFLRFDRFLSVQGSPWGELEEGSHISVVLIILFVYLYGQWKTLDSLSGLSGIGLGIRRQATNPEGR